MKVTIQETNTVLTVSEAAKVIASGNDTEVQFNDGGSLAGASFFTLDKDTSSATLSGNFAVTGTVDGRDIAADGSKLDGIENNAKDDQTGPEILSLLLDEDGTGSGLDADLLDGQHGSYFLDYTNFTGTPPAPTLDIVTTEGNTTTNAITVGNITTTGYLRGPSTFVLDPATHGDDTGTLVVAGNLQVDGTTTTINSTELTVDDLNIVVASGAVDAAAANGAGITIDGANASLTYDASEDTFVVNKPFVVSSTWNDAGTIFEGLRVDVVDTASDASSMPFEINLNGTPIIQVDKTGTFVTGGVDLNAVGGNIIPDTDSAYDIGSDSLRWANVYADTGSFTAGGDADFITSTFSRLYDTLNYSIWAVRGSNTGMRLSNQFLTIETAAYLGWGTTGIGSPSSPDLRLYRDAAGTLAQRNGTNAQTFNVYGTYTDDSNYERLSIGYSDTNQRFEIVRQRAGTGNQQRDLYIGAQGAYLLLDEAGAYDKAVLNANHVIQILSGNESINLSAGFVNISTNGSEKVRVTNAGLSVTGGTVTSSDPVISGSQTWNNAGVDFTGALINVVDTASGAGSKLLDLQVGGESRFSVSPSSGGITFGTVAAGYASFTTGAGRIKTSQGLDILTTSAPLTIGTGWGQFSASQNDSLFLTKTNGGGETVGIVLSPGTSGVAEVRNGTNAQTFNVYKSYTDASNYTRVGLNLTGAQWTFGGEASGTGSGMYGRINLHSDYNTYIQSDNSGYGVTIGNRYGSTYSFGQGGFNLNGNSFGYGGVYPTGVFTLGSTTNPGSRFTTNAISSSAQMWFKAMSGDSRYTQAQNPGNGIGIGFLLGSGDTPLDANADGGDAGLFEVWLGQGGDGRGTGIRGRDGYIRIVNDSAEDREAGRIGLVPVQANVHPGIEIAAGDATVTDEAGADLILKAGAGDGAGSDGSVVVQSADGSTDDVTLNSAGITFPSTGTHGIKWGNYASLLRTGSIRYFAASGPTFNLPGNFNAGLSLSTSGSERIGFRLESGTIWSNGGYYVGSGAFTGNESRIIGGSGGNQVNILNGTNAQTVNIYGTYTDASNYERLAMGYDGSEFYIRPEDAGTGGNRDLRLGDGANAGNGVLIDNDGQRLSLFGKTGLVQAVIERTSTDRVYIGSETNHLVAIIKNGVPALTINTSDLIDFASGYSLRFGRDSLPDPAISVVAKNDDTATAPFVFQAQGAFDSAVTNQDGGDLVLRGGASATGGGTNGSVVVQSADGLTDLFTMAPGGTATLSGTLRLTDPQFDLVRISNQVLGFRLFGGGSSTVAATIVRSFNPHIAAYKQSVGDEPYLGLAGNVVASLAAPDVRLYRGGADIFEMRRTANAQEFRIYGTYTDASNYERLSMGYNSGSSRFEIGLENAGTGAARQLRVLNDESIVLDGGGTYPVQIIGSSIMARWREGSSYGMESFENIFPNTTGKKLGLLAGSPWEHIYAGLHYYVEQSADPADPAEGESVIWQSDGTGTGDDGDLYAKFTAGGVTKTVQITDFSSGTVAGGGGGGGGSSLLVAESSTLSTVTPTVIASFDSASFSSCKFIVTATQGTARHSTELLCTHNGATAISVEYASIFTTSALATYEVQYTSGTVELVATGASATSTQYNVTKVLTEA